MKRQRGDSLASNSSLDTAVEAAKVDDSPKPKKDDKPRCPDSWTISGFDGLRPVCRPLCFSPDLNVFNELVEATYAHLCSAVPEYSRNVSMGMFSYYCGVALWYRLYAIRSAQGGDPTWTFPCMKVDFPHGFYLPAAFCKFLDTIGDFTEHDGVYWKLVFPMVNSDGHFGPMSADSFYKYLAYPAPAVLIATLQQELDVITEKKKVYSEWKLTSIDFENCPDNLVFTENVCGYYVPPCAAVYQVEPDDVITEQLARGLKDLNALESPEIWINKRLTKHVFNFNWRVRKEYAPEYPMMHYENRSKYGSTAQMGFVEFSAADHDGEQDDYSSSSKEVQGFSPCLLPVSVSKLIPLFRLRAKRTPSVKALPYSFSTTDEVPDTWLEKLNAQFEFGDAQKRWNLGIYTTGAVDRKLAINDFVRGFSRIR